MFCVLFHFYFHANCSKSNIGDSPLNESLSDKVSTGGSDSLSHDDEGPDSSNELPIMGAADEEHKRSLTIFFITLVVGK